jgi:Resolvase, N terminal domain
MKTSRCPMKPQRVALYARVLTKNNGQDPETQLIALREYAGHRGMTFTDEYVDVGISGGRIAGRSWTVSWLTRGAGGSMWCSWPGSIGSRGRLGT